MTWSMTVTVRLHVFFISTTFPSPFAGIRQWEIRLSFLHTTSSLSHCKGRINSQKLLQKCSNLFLKILKSHLRNSQINLIIPYSTPCKARPPDGLWPCATRASRCRGRRAGPRPQRWRGRATGEYPPDGCIPPTTA